MHPLCALTVFYGFPGPCINWWNSPILNTSAPRRTVTPKWQPLYPVTAEATAGLRIRKHLLPYPGNTAVMFE